MKFKKPMFKVKTLIASFVFATFITPTLSADVFAQAAEKARASGWFKTCNEDDKNKVCSVQYQVVGEKNNLLVSLSFVRVTGEVKSHIFRILVPTGRTLTKGVQVQVDGKNASVLPYGFCRPKICAAEVQANDALVKIFKNGGKLDITSIDFRGRPNLVPVTLKGFTAAFDGEPQKRQQTSQEKLKQQLEEKLKAGEIKAE